MESVRYFTSALSLAPLIMHALDITTIHTLKFAFCIPFLLTILVHCSALYKGTGLHDTFSLPDLPALLGHHF